MYTRNEKIIPIYIEEEMKDSYINYAMSVIVGRALPDARDGLKPVHRRILYAMKELNLEHNRPYKKSARIVGECFVKDTLVLTEKGLVSIEDIKKGDMVYTQNGLRRVTELYEMPPKGLLKVELANGTYNIVTPLQKFKVLNRNFEFKWKEACRLKQGDYIVLKCYYPDVRRCVKLKRIHQLNPDCLDEDIAYLLGIFMSDGWITKNNRDGVYRIGFSNNKCEVIEKIADILMKKFDYLPTIEKKEYLHRNAKEETGTNCRYIVRINKGRICNFLIENFKLADLKASSKYIPRQIFVSPRSVIYAFVSGLIDGNGSVHRTQSVVNYSSVSRKLIDQLQILLQQLGIFSTRHVSSGCYKKYHFITTKRVCNRPKFYTLEIKDIDAKLLSSKLCLYDRKKDTRCVEIQEEKFKMSTSEIIPYGGENISVELKRNHIWGGRYISESGKEYRHGIKYKRGYNIRYPKNLIEKPLRELQNYIVQNDIYFMEVSSVRPAPSQVTYDIQVEDEHEFVANGMLSHNCLGKYHPHGDMAVYDALVRMAQDFSLRYPLIDGQGNFGSIDGDPAAAMRYTEARLHHITDWMLADIEKDTVRFVPNFDGSLNEPTILPAILPNLILNGSSGIAVGMATNIPPHNLSEVVEAVCCLIDNPDCTVKDLMRKIKGPDFPTGGIICGLEGIKKAYERGRGRLLVHAKASIETQKNGRESIIITEIPYQVNKTNLIESIAKLVQDRKIEGISDLRDESDKEGMRIVVELKRGQNAQVILNQLYKHTQMQATFGVIMLALVGNRPRILNLKELLSIYIDHRKEMIVRRTKFDLEKAESRAHILEGLKIALKNLDRIINIIKKSKDPDRAREELMARFKLTEKQAQAILEMQLQRLTGLERTKIDKEYVELLKKIEILRSILASEKRVLGIIKEELRELDKRFGDERRTQIVGEVEEIKMEDLIQEEDVVITITHSGYIKRLPVSSYRKQRRGGRGVTAAGMKEEDFVEDLFVASTHDNLLFFTDKGKAYVLKVYDIPQAGRIAKGKAIVNLLSLSAEERITSSIPVKEFSDDRYLMMVTKEGKIKKTVLSAFANIRRTGIIALSLSRDDSLISAKLTSGKDEIFIATQNGMAIRFNEKGIRDMGRTAQGVRGIKLNKKDKVIGMEVISDKKASLLSITERGFGKRTEAQEYRIQSRGGKGIINIKVTDKNGAVVGLNLVSDSDDVMLITAKGMVVRCPVKDIRITGRAAQGVRIIKLEKGDKVVSVARVIKE